MCAARCTGVGPPALHAAVPMFVTVTGMSARPPGKRNGAGPAAYVAVNALRTFAGRSCGTTPRLENHANPSCTRSMRSVYAPGRAGERTGSDTVAAPPAATSPGRAARVPSQVTTDPLCSQWYERWTGVGPPADHVVVPV